MRKKAKTVSLFLMSLWLNGSFSAIRNLIHSQMHPHYNSFPWYSDKGRVQLALAKFAAYPDPKGKSMLKYSHAVFILIDFVGWLGAKESNYRP